MGALPNVLPGYQQVANAEARQKFEKAWNCKIKDKPGLPMTEMMNSAARGEIKAMYIVGENPILSEPDSTHTRNALQNWISCWWRTSSHRDPPPSLTLSSRPPLTRKRTALSTSTERRVQKVNAAVTPPGDSKPDWQIVSMLANKMGYPFPYQSVREINEEITSLTPIYGGMKIGRLEACYGLQWPCRDVNDAGTPTLHVGKFSCGLGKFFPVEYKAPAETVSAAYPLMLTTGRILEHFHTGSMSRRTKVLNGIEPTGFFDINPEDAAGLGINEGDKLQISSARGEIKAPA